MAEGNVRPSGRLARLMAWLDERMPLTETIEYHATKYYAPKNFNFWYYFGILGIGGAGRCRWSPASG